MFGENYVGRTLLYKQKMQELFNKTPLSIHVKNTDYYKKNYQNTIKAVEEGGGGSWEDEYQAT